MNENKFNNKAKVYEEARPSYTKELLDFLYSDDLFEGRLQKAPGLTSGSLIADIGSGTGKLTKLLLERGSNVFAIEPNDDMRTVAENNLSKFPNFTSVKAATEGTTLADKSVDFITVAQAFHWFDVKEFQNECRRILKDNGTVILIWNETEKHIGFGIAYEEFLKVNCATFRGFGGGYKNNFNRIESFFNKDYCNGTIASELSYDKDKFIKRALSSSYTPKENDASYEHFIDKLGKLFDKHQIDGKIKLTNNTNYYVGKISANSIEEGLL